MKQAVLTGPKTIEVQETERPSAGPHEVVVKVEVCGICGSDLHMYGGNHPVLRPPLVMGHEFSGYITETGDGVKRFRTGDFVAVIPAVGCGVCEHCREGKFNLCRKREVIGGQHPGGLAEYAKVPEENLILLPPNFTAVQGALVECTAVAVHAVRKVGEISGKSFAVFGAGPIGLLIAQTLKAFGARFVAVSDPIESRRMLAVRLGADLAIDPIGENVEERIAGAECENGVDGAFDAAGLAQTLNQAMNVTKNGGSIVIVAMFGPKVDFAIQALQRTEKTLIGTQMYTREDFELGVRLLDGKRIRVEEMVTHRFPLERTSEAFRLIDARSRDAGKVIIDMNMRK
jgi:L-iditol 2-dehydrogenase